MCEARSSSGSTATSANDFRDENITAYARNAALLERFRASEGRPPEDGELTDLALRVYDEIASDPMSLVSTMIRQHDAMAEMLNQFHLQLVVLAGNGLPGFVIGDTPGRSTAAPDFLSR